MPLNSDHHGAVSASAQRTKDNPSIATLLTQLQSLLTSIPLPKTPSAKNCSVPVETLTKANAITNALIARSKDVPTLYDLLQKVEKITTRLDQPQSYAKVAGNGVINPKSSKVDPSTSVPQPRKYNPNTDILVGPVDRTKPLFETTDLSSLQKSFNSIITELDIRDLEETDSLTLARSISRTRSGGYRITFRNAHEREAACSPENFSKWANRLSPNLGWKGFEYPIIVHSIPTTFDINLDSNDFKILLRDNFGDHEDNEETHAEYLGFTRAHWINRQTSEDLQKRKKHSSLVIYCTNPDRANLCIEEQISICGTLHRTERFRALPLQCFKCRKYGHVAAMCHNDPRCGSCAGKHLTRDCKCPMPTPCADSAHCTHIDVKCPACGGEHRDTDPTCPSRAAALSRASEYQSQVGGKYPVYDG
jgi:hypothetical protein